MPLNMELFLQKVKENKILYDLSHEDYKNNRKKDRIWDTMGTEFDASGEELKRKWKNMRDTYAKYLKTTKTSTGQSAAKNYSRWQWAPHIEFLKPFLAFANTLSNINDTVNETVNDTETNDIDQSSQVISDETSQQTAESRRNKEVLASPVEKVINYLQNRNPVEKELDALEHLFMGFAKTVKTFTPRRQAAVKMKISQIVMENELQHLDELTVLEQPYTSNSRPLSASLRSSGTSSSSISNCTPENFLRSSPAPRESVIVSDILTNDFDALSTTTPVTCENFTGAFYSSFNPDY